MSWTPPDVVTKDKMYGFVDEIVDNTVKLREKDIAKIFSCITGRPVRKCIPMVKSLAKGLRETLFNDGELVLWSLCKIYFAKRTVMTPRKCFNGRVYTRRPRYIRVRFSSKFRKEMRGF